MQVSVESGEGLERRVTVQLPAGQIDGEIEQRLKKIAKTARLKGFRPGKVPLSVVHRQFGKQVRQEVVGELIRSSFGEALQQENLHIAAEPSIDPIEELEDGVRYTARFEVMPEFELAALEGVTVERPVVEIGEQDVDAMVEKLRKQRVTWNAVEREAADGDQVRIDFQGTIDGEAFEGGSGSDVAVVIGSGAMIPGLEQGLKGCRVGEKRTMDVEFPDDYGAQHLAGKQAVFSVEVLGVSEPIMPEVDADFAKAFGVEEGSVETLRADIRSNMEREAIQAIAGQVKGRVMDVLLEANKIDVPRALVEREIKRMQEQATSQVKASGRTKNFELPRDLFADQAQRRVTLGLILAEIVRTHNIEVDAARVRTKVEEFASTYEEPDEVIKWYYGNREQLAGVESMVHEEQVVDWALEQASVVEQAMSFDELMASREKS